MTIKLGRAYRHIKSGKEVLTQEFSQSKINGKWIDSIIYSRNKSEKYVRTVDDFLSCCELITK